MMKPSRNRPFTLRWQKGDEPQFDLRYEYMGDTQDKNLTFSQYRERCISKGLNNGKTLIGEIRRVQIRMPLKHSGYEKVGQQGDVIVLFNTRTLKTELWGKYDDCVGFVIEHQGRGYSFSTIITDEKSGQLTLDELERIENLRRLHTPTDEQTKPSELIERDAGAGFEEFRASGTVLIPVPSQADMDAVRQEVVVAARNDLGQVRPTPAYFRMNPIEGEITMHEATEAENIILAQGIAIAAMSRKNVDEALAMLVDYSNAQMMGVVENQGIERPLEKGTKYDLEFVETRALEYLRFNMRVEDEGITSLIYDMRGRLHLDQENIAPSAMSVFPEAHIVKVMRTDERIDEGVGNVTICGLLVREGEFVGLDQFMQVGPPPYTPICMNCVCSPQVTRPDISSVLPSPMMGMSATSHGLLSQRGDNKRSLGEMMETEGISVPRDAIETQEQLAADNLEEAERIKKARLGIEDYIRNQVLSPGAKKEGFHYFRHLALAIFDFRRTEGKGIMERPILSYAMMDTITRKIHQVGSDYAPSANALLREYPTGRLSARELLLFWEEDDPDLINEWADELSYTDQYDDPVPQDLTAIPVELEGSDSYNVPNPDLEKIMAARWYEINTVLFVSLAEIGYGDAAHESSPSDLGLDVDTHDIMRVADPLKRWSEEDGFYYA